MNGIGLVTAALALLVGFVVGALTMRARTATLAAERDAARTERDTVRGERDSAHTELDEAEEHLRQAQTERARLETQLEHARSSADEKIALLRTEQERLTQEFERLSNDALRRNRADFLELATEQLKGSEERTKTELEHRREAVEALVKPLNDQLTKITDHANELERHRTAAYAELRSQIETMGQNSEKLRLETQQLTTALRAPQIRGRWGELQLRRVVEAAGMLEHVDFVEQASVNTADGKLRPDLLVNIAGDKHVVVDAKVAFNGYLEAQEAPDDNTRQARLKAHARHLKTHIGSLSGKQYWAQFAPAPEFVVMFVPSDVFLNAALEQDPTLYEHAFERNVVLATPSTLVALLRTVGYTWRQEALARNAHEVLQLGRELHNRLSTMSGHVGKLGRQLDNAVKAYNDTVSSLESRVLVTARRMSDLKVVDEELDAPGQVESATRSVQAPELTTSAPETTPSEPPVTGVDDIRADQRYGVDHEAPPTRADGTHG